jgi:diguanylate cyclase (GGDEF)-like protein/putative nucleotidyltransferase with HDIG domain
LNYLTRTAQLYIGTVITAGLAAFAIGIYRWNCQDPLRFACFLFISAVASVLKVTLPGVTGTMSVSYVFILTGVEQMSLGETLLLGCAGSLIQTIWRCKHRPKLIQPLFNVASMAFSIALAYVVFHAWSAPKLGGDLLKLAVAACAFFVANTGLVTGVVSLTEGKSASHVWRECYFWSFPYYLVGASIAGGISIASDRFGWPAPLAVLPVIYTIHRSYRLYLARLSDERDHAQQMARLHLETIESLALAIEAKDHTTHDHLHRVQVYAAEIGRDLRLSDDEMQALRAASILHDIGKLAVPEHILSKPGKLSPEEFEKIKIHPVVGAEILARVHFPYPVVPIVRAHHEKWDGSGYPDGLKGQAIPMGARILAAVDCLDALASDRQYRPAMPVGYAMAFIRAEAGKAFDPEVVDALEHRYGELEQMAASQPVGGPRLSRDVPVTNGKRPDAGLETTGPAFGDPVPDFLSSIAAAREEAQMLFELTQALGNSLSLHETLSVLDSRLSRLVPYDAIAIYIRRGDVLVPEYASGENSRMLASLQIPVGSGLSGWVVENGKPIINGNPSVEPGYVQSQGKSAVLGSALAVPLQGMRGAIGVLALYRVDRDAFARDDLRLLLAVNLKVSLAIENALTYRQAEITATTDELTDLPNARSLFLHLDAELARAKRLRSNLAVLVCDLDGFKQINDRYGHLEGNKVLKAVAASLREACREYDYLARMGGDEFVILLPGLRPQDLPEKLAQLERMVNEAGYRICGDRGLSISGGAAFYPDDAHDAETLLAEGDRRMYHCKQNRKSKPPEIVPELSMALATTAIQ